MDRTLILDEEGNAVITCNESYDIITFLIGESYDRRGLIPGKKFSLSGVGSLKAIRDYLNCVITREEQMRQLKQKLEVKHISLDASCKKVKAKLEIKTNTKAQII